jgi:hypothetical protein
MDEFLCSSSSPPPRIPSSATVEFNRPRSTGPSSPPPSCSRSGPQPSWDGRRVSPSISVSRLYAPKVQKEDESTQTERGLCSYPSVTYPRGALIDFGHVATPQIDCIKGTRHWETCEPTFANRGHFENLLAVTTVSPGATSAAETPRWRYPAYLLANNGHNGPKDYINLTEYTSGGKYAPLASVRFDPCDLPD